MRLAAERHRRWTGPMRIYPLALAFMIAGCSSSPSLVERSDDSVAWMAAPEAARRVDGYAYVQSDGATCWLGVAPASETGIYYRVCDDMVPKDEQAIVWSAFESGKLISMTWDRAGNGVSFSVR